MRVTLFGATTYLAASSPWTTVTTARSSLVPNKSAAKSATACWEVAQV